MVDRLINTPLDRRHFAIDPIDIRDNAQASIATSTTGAQSAALTGGIYDVWASADTYIKVNSTASDVTSATGYLLYAGNTLPVLVREQDKIGGIVTAGTGTLSYHKVD